MKQILSDKSHEDKKSYGFKIPISERKHAFDTKFKRRMTEVGIKPSSS